MIFAANTLSISSANDDGAGNVTFTLAYSFDDVVAGFQFDFLTDGVFTLTGASGGASDDAGMMVSTNESGTVIGFSMTGATIASGTGTFLELTGTYDVANAGTDVSVYAYDSCADDGTDDNDHKKGIHTDDGASSDAGVAPSSVFVEHA